MKKNEKHLSSHSRVIFPGNTEIYQPNRVTNGKHESFTLLQSRILINLIKELQAAILASLNGKNWQQLNLFESVNTGIIRIPIKLKDITTPNQYYKVYDAAIKLARISIQLPSSLGKDYITIATLFPRVHLPVTQNANRVMYLEMFTETANKLIEIDKTVHGKPGFFTRYLYEVAMNAKCKYTYKLYMIIASWKSKGFMKISLNDLREQLGLNNDEYSDYRLFKRRILKPVQQDLQNKSDCWFNCESKGFEERRGRCVVYLNFKLIIPLPEEKLREKSQYILHLLQTHFDFNPDQLKTAREICSGILSQRAFDEILLKLQTLKQRISISRTGPDAILNVPQYVLKSLGNLVNG